MWRKQERRSYLVWFDDGAGTLEEKVEGAANFYRQKYGYLPAVCLVNPHHTSSTIKVGAVEVCPQHNVLKHHFFLGDDHESSSQT